jgi:hypothetical protein
VKRGLPGAGAGHRVEVDQSAPAPRELLNGIDVALLVDPQKLLAPGGRRLDELEAQPVSLGHGLLDRN